MLNAAGIREFNYDPFVEKNYKEEATKVASTKKDPAPLVASKESK